MTTSAQPLALSLTLGRVLLDLRPIVSAHADPPACDASRSPARGVPARPNHDAVDIGHLLVDPDNWGITAVGPLPKL
jgi:hypothetical protein